MNDRPRLDLTAPPHLTDAAQDFFHAAHEDFALFHFVIDVVLAGDYIRFVARRALDDQRWDHVPSPAVLAKSEPGSATEYLRAHRQQLLEMFLTRAVDSFQKFVVDLLGSVLRSQPSILKSREPSLSLEELLDFGSMDELLDSIVERKVDSLSYRGFTALQDWAATRGIPIVVPNEQSNELIELIEARNVVAHNRGVVDAKYLRTVKNPPFELGQCRTIDIEAFLSSLQLLASVVTATDDAAAEKFHLPRSAWRPCGSGQSQVSVAQNSGSEGGGGVA